MSKVMRGGCGASAMFNVIAGGEGATAMFEVMGSEGRQSCSR